MLVSEHTYKLVALEDPEGQWELVCGRLRQKPLMTIEHEETARALLAHLVRQLDPQQFTVGQNSGRLRVPSGNYRVPDVCVIPRTMVRRLLAQPRTFEVYDDPVPLVVEVWSPSTGAYDVEEKLREYQQRGDVEIWLIHPYDRTLTAWRRLADGTYERQIYSGGRVDPASLPGVSIDLDFLFE